MAARQQWPERSWEMRWYRERACQLIRDERPYLVAFADEEVVDVARRRDARVRDRSAELLRGAELSVLRRDDQRAIGNRRQRAGCEGHVLRPDADERDGVDASAAREEREGLKGAEAVSDQAQRKPRRHRSRVVDGGLDVIGLIAATGPLAGARANTAEVEAQRVPPALCACARDRGHDRSPHRAAVRWEGVRDHHDRGRLDIGYAQSRLEPPVDATRLLAHE